MLPNDSDISKELIFFLKDRLGLSDTSIFIDEYSLSTKEENLIKEFIKLKSKGFPLDYILQNTSFYKDDFYVVKHNPPYFTGINLSTQTHSWVCCIDISRSKMYIICMDTCKNESNKLRGTQFRARQIWRSQQQQQVVQFERRIHFFAFLALLGSSLEILLAHPSS